MNIKLHNLYHKSLNLSDQEKKGNLASADGYISET